ncbi:TetR/AcrR family transcriptional regulator [Nocardiopsis aegyptia]|uniref:AcrR family transcriptional regulator n=1 Tax=Nocardiopsis aegyptia TaxID=220378 RepID=A0A7Z0EN66_9ACTN|nr:TetR/AcrR family transcriptional regulator [Nocardiopsis aegyptia]NYJ34974.1 AcrR family transcriptional regulator [Nocardiopsis aegyptia]
MGRLNAEDWARAALGALAEGGLRAVAVEAVAARLGVSKGSFYWHFGNRRDLVDAALRLWESDTEAVIAELEGIADPARRMRTLLELALGEPTDARISFWLISGADDPAVAEVARRVTDRRMAVMQDALRLLGQSEDEARARVVAGYGSYLGIAALVRIGAIDAAPDTFVDQALTEMGVR